MLADVTGASVTVPPLDLIAGRAGAAIVTGTAGTPGGDVGGVRTFTPDLDLAATHWAGLIRYRDLYQTAQFGNQPRLVTRAGTR